MRCVTWLECSPLSLSLSLSPSSCRRYLLVLPCNNSIVVLFTRPGERNWENYTFRYNAGLKIGVWYGALKYSFFVIDKYNYFISLTLNGNNYILLNIKCR